MKLSKYLSNKYPNMNSDNVHCWVGNLLSIIVIFITIVLVALPIFI